MDNSYPIYYFVVNVLNITSGKQGKTLQYVNKTQEASNKLLSYFKHKTIVNEKYF